MLRELLLLLCLLSLAGCSGLSGDSTAASPSESGEPWEYRIVIENGYDTAQEFTVSLTTESGQQVVNETRRVRSGERWIATTLSESEHSDQEYSLTIATAAGGKLSEDFNATPQKGVTRISGAALYKIGRGGTEVHVCGGTVTCYKETTS